VKNYADKGLTLGIAQKSRYLWRSCQKLLTLCRNLF
jgi:hypothetical protein